MMRPLVLLSSAALAIAMTVRAAPPASQPATGPATRAAPGTRPAGEYIEYRARPDLGRIEITDCAVRGEAAVRRLAEGATELAEQGVFACPESGKRRVHDRGNRPLTGCAATYVSTSGHIVVAYAVVIVGTRSG